MSQSPIPIWLQDLMDQGHAKFQENGDVYIHDPLAILQTPQARLLDILKATWIEQHDNIDLYKDDSLSPEATQHQAMLLELWSAWTRSAAQSQTHTADSDLARLDLEYLGLLDSKAGMDFEKVKIAANFIIENKDRTPDREQLKNHLSEI